MKASGRRLGCVCRGYWSFLNRQLVARPLLRRLFFVLLPFPIFYATIISHVPYIRSLSDLVMLCH
jgi:thiaminase